MNPSRPIPRSPTTALGGWRARAWAWVLFAALLKGLIPQVAFAAVLMPGDPAAVFCNPASNAGKPLAAAGQAAMADHGACVCAAAGGDGSLPQAAWPGLPGEGVAAAAPAPDATTPIARAGTRLPPACGPPV